jgi:hypothetical protein
VQGTEKSVPEKRSLFFEECDPCVRIWASLQGGTRTCVNPPPPNPPPPPRQNGASGLGEGGAPAVFSWFPIKCSIFQRSVFVCICTYTEQRVFWTVPARVFVRRSQLGRESVLSHSYFCVHTFTCTACVNWLNLTISSTHHTCLDTCM